MRTTANRVAGRDRPATTAVDSHLSRPAHDRKRDVLAGRKYDRTHGQGKWVHGHEDQVAKSRFENWPTAGECVRGRTSRGGDHDSIGIDDPDRLAADVDLDPQHPRRARVVHDHLIETDRPGNRPLTAAEHDLQDGALFDPVITVEKATQPLIEL